MTVHGDDISRYEEKFRDVCTSITESYLRCFPDELERLAPLRKALADRDRFFGSRARTQGHLTASGIVLDPTRLYVLLVHHRKLDRWLQPGGHIETGEMPRDAAEREIHEETGVVELLPLQWRQGDMLPIDIDIHEIPENRTRSEGAHFHFDCRYLFVAQIANDSPRTFRNFHSGNGLGDSGWFPLASVVHEERMDRLRRVFRKMKDFGVIGELK